jgi:hypothetical protein
LKEIAFKEMAMRFHDERERRLHPIRLSHAPPLYPMRTIWRPKDRHQDDGIAGDSLVVTLCYEAHLAMQQMLAVFAEVRGDNG